MDNGLELGKKYNGVWILMDDSHPKFNLWRKFIANYNSYAETFDKNVDPNVMERQKNECITWKEKLEIFRQYFEKGYTINEAMNMLGMNISSIPHDLIILYNKVNGIYTKRYKHKEGRHNYMRENGGR